MIFVRDRGRMANNILQYAHLYAWGREHGRKTLSMRLAYKYPYFRISRSFRHNFLSYLAGKWGAALGILPVADFDAPDADPKQLERMMETTGNIMVQGWNVRFYDLFEKYIDEIRHEFSFLPSICRKTGRKLDEVSGKDAMRIGLHIRRGDYARWQNGRFFYDDDQYSAVIASFVDSLGDTHKEIIAVVCGNDPKLDRDSLARRLSPCGVRLLFPDGNPGEDLCALSLCDCIIGPPSTFSLVAAMMRDIPLYWIKNPSAPVNYRCFSRFNILFREII